MVSDFHVLAGKWLPTHVAVCDLSKVVLPSLCKVVHRLKIFVRIV